MGQTAITLEPVEIETLYLSMHVYLMKIHILRSDMSRSPFKVRSQIHTVKSVIEAHTLIEANPLFCKKKSTKWCVWKWKLNLPISTWCVWKWKLNSPIAESVFPLRYLRHLDQSNYAVINAYSVSCRHFLSLGDKE